MAEICLPRDIIHARECSPGQWRHACVGHYQECFKTQEALLCHLNVWNPQRVSRSCKTLLNPCGIVISCLITLQAFKTSGYLLCKWALVFRCWLSQWRTLIQIAWSSWLRSMISLKVENGGISWTGCEEDECSCTAVVDLVGVFLGFLSPSAGNRPISTLTVEVRVRLQLIRVLNRFQHLW
jgi:hypothetical protein